MHQQKANTVGTLLSTLRDLLEAPDVVRVASIHRRGNAKRLVDAGEVVVDEVEGDGGVVILHFMLKALVRRVK